MDKRVYLLTIVSFVVGMAELIIGGILNLLAEDLQVTIQSAGLLITIFSLIFAIGAPILLNLTQHIERKRLTSISLIVFFIGNMLAFFSASFTMLFVARIISALSGALLAVLCMTLAASIVEKRFVGRAIGLVIMGTSGSLVLGVPIGQMLGHSFGWQMPFLFISVLTIGSLIGVHFFMTEIKPTPFVPLKKQLQTLKNRRILFAQLTMFFYLTGHLTIYAYLNPFAKDILHLSDGWTTVVYFLFGVAAITGGGLGGTLSDRFGARNITRFVIVIFAFSLFALPLTKDLLPLFFVVLIVWGMMSWSITPALQTYLIEIAPETAQIQQSLNNSALHFGIAFGSFVGGLVIAETSVLYTPIAGGVFIVLAFITASLSMARPEHQTSDE